MQIQRSADTDSKLTNEIYLSAVEFYWAYLANDKDLFVDNDDEDLSLVMHDLDVHSDDAFITLRKLEKSSMFDGDNIDNILAREIRTNGLLYSDDDIASLKANLVSYIGYMQDAIFNEAVNSFLGELDIELTELDARSKKEEVTEAKGEWIA